MGSLNREIVRSWNGNAHGHWDGFMIRPLKPPEDGMHLLSYRTSSADIGILLLKPVQLVLKGSIP